MAENFTDFRVTVLPAKDFGKVGSGNTKAMVSCLVGGVIWITRMRIMEGMKGLFVVIPSIRNKAGEYVDSFFPAGREVRVELQTKCIEAYKDTLEKGGA